MNLNINSQSIAVSVGARFNAQTQTELAPFTPRFNFDSEKPATSTSSTPGQDKPIVLTASQSHSPSIVVNGNKTATATVSGAEYSPHHISQSLNPTQPQIIESSKLNRSDINELLNHPHLIAPHQTNFLHNVERKRQLYPQRYRDDYLRHSSLLLLTNGWSSAQRYSLCSVRNAVNPSGQCKLHKFCPYCAFLQQRHNMARYVPAFDDGVWHFVTGSFTGDLLMRSAADYYELTDYWDAYKSALQELVRLNLLRGVFWTEELAVNSIAPVQTLPHIHAIVEADEMSDETMQQLNSLVVQNLKSVLGPDHLSPNIHAKTLSTQRNLLSHVQYTIKPIQIVKAYDTSFARSVHNNRSGVALLNSETTDLVLGYSVASKDRQRINSAGNLSSKTKNYIGTKEGDIEAAKEHVNDVIKQGTDYIEMNSEQPTIEASTNNEP